MSDFKTYQRVGSIEARPWTAAEAKQWREHPELCAISINNVDIVHAGMPEPVGMVARNPANPLDQWYIAPTYFAAHYTEPESRLADLELEVAELRARLTDFAGKGTRLMVEKLDAQDEVTLLRSQLAQAREKLMRYLPRFEQKRYFNTDGQHPYERSISEVRAKCDELSETKFYTVVEPAADLGYIIHVGGNQPREWVLDELREKLEREYRDWCDSATPPAADADPVAKPVCGTCGHDADRHASDCGQSCHHAECYVPGCCCQSYCCHPAQSKD